MNDIVLQKIGTLLKSHYERILYPLDIFEKEEAAKVGSSTPRHLREGGGSKGRILYPLDIFVKEEAAKKEL